MRVWFGFIYRIPLSPLLFWFNQSDQRTTSLLCCTAARVWLAYYSPRFQIKCPPGFLFNEKARPALLN